MIQMLVTKRDGKTSLKHPPQQQKEVAHLLQQVGASALPSLPQQPQQLARLLQQVGTPHSAAVQT